MQTPEVFGLHANADIQYYTNATKALWRNLVELQPRTAGTGTGITREEFIEKTAKDILQALPDTFDMPQLRKELGLPSPTQVVLLQELERWNQCAPKAYVALRVHLSCSHAVLLGPSYRGIEFQHSAGVGIGTMMSSVPRLCTDAGASKP